jgi:hypothetical protein
LRKIGKKSLKEIPKEELITLLHKYLFEPFFNKDIFVSTGVGCDYAFGKTKLFLKDHAYD